MKCAQCNAIPRKHEDGLYFCPTLGCTNTSIFVEEISSAAKEVDKSKVCADCNAIGEETRMGRWFCANPDCKGKQKLSNAAKEVDKPSHYLQPGGIECIDAIAEAVKDLKGVEAFCIGNSVKYLWRFDKKNGSEDLKKALWYIERALADRKKRDAK